MLTSAGITALSLLIGLPGFGLKHRSRAPADTIPPVWKTASRLALEDQLVLGAVEPQLTSAMGLPGFKVTNDDRKLSISVDPDSGEVEAGKQLGDVDLGFEVRENLTDYSRSMTQANFRRIWADRSRQSINSLGNYTVNPNAPTERTGLSFQLPSPLPKQVQSVLGPGGPALNVSGSENIVLSGTSNWTNQQTGPLGQKKSLFPSLDMQQSLDIRLEGQLSDRIRVNLLQNSLNQIPLSNRIAINYKGDEDDLIQEFDLGNTNLSLPGTQYVSYSGRNEGLFGMKASSRLGPVDLTLLASKQEGRSERASYAGGASRQSWTLYNHEYLKGIYFLLYDPNQQALDIPDNSLRVYRDDGNYSNTDVTTRGRAFVDPTVADTASLHGNFRLLNPGPTQDYEILHTVYGPAYKVLRLVQPLNYEQRLAVTYIAGHFTPQGSAVGDYVPVGGDTLTYGDGEQEIRMKLIRAPLSMLVRNDDGDFADSVGFTAVRNLELKNFYQLPGQRIDPTTLTLTIQRGDDEPPKTFVIGPGGVSVPYLEVLGLDNYDETTGSPITGHDGRLDGTYLKDSRLFVDYDSGVLFFYDLRPFAPRLDRPFEKLLSDQLNRRVLLNGDPGTPNAPNPRVYDHYNPERKDADFRITVEFTAQRVAGEINLGRGNIIEGSDVVTINGRTLLRDQDYTIDYDLGRVTLKRQLGPADNLNIDYSYAPLFQQAGRTLVGGAFNAQGRDRSLGGAFLYESRGAQDVRPRLGDEPSRSMIGDLNGTLTTRPDWMTRLADKLPGVRTTTPSEFHIEGEVGASFPNPNTRNEVYIDDMEGVRDAVSLTMSQDHWRWSSVPGRHVGAGTVSMLSLSRVHNAEVHWYSPFAVVKEKDLKPTLKQAEGADNNRQVLAISVPRFPRSGDPSPIPGDPKPGDSLWVGITYPLDQAGIDVSKSQFIELWVNDFNDLHTGVPEARVRGHHVKMHIDLGVVSEDQMRSPDKAPNHRMDTEDTGERDNQLVVTDKLNEDTGYDGFLNPVERDSVALLDLTTSTPADPSGDDFVQPVSGLEEIDTRRYRGTNGTEGNKVIFPYPDTEDLNLNNTLDEAENYFEYTIDLGDANSSYLVTDVQRDYPGGDYTKPAPDNGWRQYRIPIADPLRGQFGLPDLALARNVRVWFEGIRTPDDTTPTAKVIRPLLELGSLDIVGSRWRADLPDTLKSIGTTLTLNSVNTIDNADIYSPPFNPGETRSGSQAVTRREQSIALEFGHITPGTTLEAYKALSLDEDYSRYGKLDWYAASFEVQGYDNTAPADTGLKYFVRFSSDESGASYYELRSPMPRSSTPDSLFWNPVHLALTDLSNLKLDAKPSATPGTDTLVAPGFVPGQYRIVVGRPSFTRLRRISFGVLNGTQKTYESGRLWFNELVATDIDKSPGYAQRALVSGRIANVASYSATYNGRDENFTSVGEQRGSGNSTRQFGFNTSVDLHRFFEGTGIVLPFTYGYSQAESNPRFTAGDDVLRTGAYSTASQSVSNSSNWSLAYSRVWSPRALGLLRYTLGGITAGVNRSTNHNRNPSSVDTSQVTNGYVNYSSSIRSLMAIPLPFTRAKLYLLPERMFANYSISDRESRTYDRLGDSTGTLVLRNNSVGRASNIALGADLRPLDFFSYHVDGMRNLSLDSSVVQHLGKVNVGRIVAWRQNTATNLALPNRGNWLRPTLGWGTSYAQDNGPQLSSDLSVKAIASGQSFTAHWDLPFETLTQRTIDPRDTTYKHRRTPVWRSGLSRLGTIALDGSLNHSSNYSRIQGSPTFAYLFGFSNDPGLGGPEPHVEMLFGNQTQRSLDWHASGRTQVRTGFGSSISVAGDFTSRTDDVNGVKQRNDAGRFPDLGFEYGNISNVLGLDKIFVNPRFRTAYNRNRTALYQNEATDPTNVSTSSQWQPLLNWSAGLKNGTKLDFNLERRNTTRETFQLGQSVSTDRNTNLSFGVTRSYTQGQQVNILGKTSTVRSSITMGLTANYERRTGDTRIKREGLPDGIRNPIGEDRLSLNGTGAYGFSNNVTGNLVLGFGQNRDLQRSIVRRSIRVEMRGSFTF